MDEVNALKARIAQLETALGLCETSPQLTKLPRPVAVLLSMLAKHRMVNKQAAFEALYGARVPGKQPDSQAVRVYVYRVRNLLEKHGIKVHTVGRVGWCLTERDKERVRDYYGIKP